MRKEQAALRNALILAATLVVCLVILVVMAHGLGGG